MKRQKLSELAVQVQSEADRLAQCFGLCAKQIELSSAKNCGTTLANPTKLIRRYNLHRSFRTFSFMLRSILHCFTGLQVSAVIRET